MSWSNIIKAAGDAISKLVNPGTIPPATQPPTYVAPPPPPQPATSPLSLIQSSSQPTAAIDPSVRAEPVQLPVHEPVPELNLNLQSLLARATPDAAAQQQMQQLSALGGRNQFGLSGAPGVGGGFTPLQLQMIRAYSPQAQQGVSPLSMLGAQSDAS